MIICSVLNEQAPAWQDSSLMNITLPEVAERLKQRAGFGAGFGDKAMEVVQAYAKAFPDKKPVDIWSMVSSNRQSVVTLADAKVKQPAPVFVTWFNWQPPLFDGRIGAFHCVDICFWFYNTDVMLTHTGGGPRPKALSRKMASSLLQFMKTGDPNGAGLTPWPKYHDGQGRGAGARRHVRGEERPGPRGAEGAAAASRRSRAAAPRAAAVSRRLGPRPSGLGREVRSCEGSSRWSHRSSRRSRSSRANRPNHRNWARAPRKTWWRR